MDIQKQRSINISISEGVLAKVQAYADQNGLSRSGAITVLCMQMISANEGVTAMAQMDKHVQELSTLLNEFKKDAK